MVATIRVSRVVGRTFRIWFTSMPQLLIIAALVHVPRFVLKWTLRDVQPSSLLGRIGTAWPLIESFVVSAIVAAFAIRFVFQRLRGEPADLGRSIAIGFTRIWTVVGIVAVLSAPYIAIHVASAASISAEVSAQAARPRLGNVVAIQLATMTGWAVILVVNLMFHVATPAAVVERRGIFASLGRSRLLTQGNRTRIFGALILLMLALLPLSLPLVLTGLLHKSDLASSAIREALELVAASISCVFPIVLYHALREAKEGIGIEELAAAFE